MNTPDETFADAACRGSNTRTFFPPEVPGKHEETRGYDPRETKYDAARTICKTCPVHTAAACLELGLSIGYSDQYGMFGGRTPKERRRILKFRAIAAYHDHGPAEAAHQTGIAVGVITKWVARAQQKGAASNAASA